MAHHGGAEFGIEEIVAHGEVLRVIPQGCHGIAVVIAHVQAGRAARAESAFGKFVHQAAVVSFLFVRLMVVVVAGQRHAGISYDTNFGPSTPGAINLISGQTNGVINNVNGTGAVTSDGSPTGLSDIGDADPVGDMCSTTTGEKFKMSGQNIGNLLNAAGVTWGFFEGGFDLTVTNANGSTGCSRSTTSTITSSLKADYIPHHQPFQYYASTANPNPMRGPVRSARIRSHRRRESPVRHA